MFKKLSKRDDPRRKWLSFRRHSLLLVQPFVFAVIVSLIWMYLRGAGVYLSHEDGDTISVSIVNTLAIMDSIFSAVVLTIIWENYRKAVSCVLDQDKDEFLKYRDERIPIMIYLLLAAFSIPLICVVGLQEWHHLESGLVGMFTVSFVVALYFVIALELDNPLNSVWISERIPEEWKTAEIDARFKQEPSTGEKS